MLIKPIVFVIPILLNVAGLFCQEFAMAQDLTQIVDFPTRIPDRDDQQPYLLDILLCSNPESCTVASHSPLGKSDHMVLSADVKFGVNVVMVSILTIILSTHTA